VIGWGVEKLANSAACRPRPFSPIGRVGVQDSERNLPRARRLACDLDAAVEQLGGDVADRLVHEPAHRGVHEPLAEGPQARTVQRGEGVGRPGGAAQEPAHHGHAVERAGEGADAIRVPDPRLDPVGLEARARSGVARRAAHRVAVGPQRARQAAAAAPAADDQDPRQG